MGGIADYSGSLVLQKALKQGTSVTFSPNNSGFIQIHSSLGDTLLMDCEINLGDAFFAFDSGSYEGLRTWFKAKKFEMGALYVLGCYLLIRQNFSKLSLNGGSFSIQSNLPLGKGVSSSASLEVAVLQALASAFELDFEGTALPVVAQKVENLVVGAPCGLMDQLACYFATPGKLLPILCQPDVVFPEIEIPKELAFVGIDSGLRHFVGGASYGDVRTAAFMGYTIIASSLVPNFGQKYVESGHELPFNGFLANINPVEFQTKFLDLLPERQTGAAFLEKYTYLIDTLSKVESERTYRIRQATLHPVFEHERVKVFKDSLAHIPLAKANAEKESLYAKLGTLMNESHESYSACGLGSTATDFIVEKAKKLRHKGIYGAKITGGGNGGTVCLLVNSTKGKETAYYLHSELEQELGKKLAFFDSE